MQRLGTLIYGLVAYLVFLTAFLYAMGFVTGLVVPKTVDTGVLVPTTEAVIVNVLLLAVFAVQHSVMARRSFKKWWTRFVPTVVERSTYVLLASLALLLLFWQWRPMPTIVWQLTIPYVGMAMLALSLFGWLLVLVSTFLISHFELFGLQQVICAEAETQPHFRTPGIYRFVRHPIYLGFIIAFWAAPTMTAGHLLFAVVTTAYILVGIALEERDLVSLFGDDYRRYRQRVSMLLPLRRLSP